MLSYVFSAMIISSLLFSLISGNAEALTSSIMDGANESVTLMISLCGMMCLWSGFLEIARQSGITDKLAKVFSKILWRLFPDVPTSSKAFSYMCMNVSANLLGLSNAATPLGLSAMKELKTLNNSDTASDSMINFVVMNTASIQLVPTTVAALRQSLNSKSPFDIIVCVWITSIAALAVGLFLSKILCKFKR